VAAAATTAKSLGIPLIVIVPPTPTPSEIDAYNWHWEMCLIRCNVKFNGTPSGPGIHRGSGHHHGTHRHRQRQRRVRTADGGVCTDAGSTNAGGTIFPTNWRSTEGLRAPTTDNRSTAADHRPANETVPAPAMRPYRAGTTNTNSQERTGRSLEETNGTRNQRGFATGTGRHDPRRTAIWRGSPRFEHAVSEWVDVSSRSSPGCSPGFGRQRPEMSRLPRLFRVESNSVRRLDCSTPDGHTTQARQLSRRTFEDAVCIQSPEGSRLRPDLATRPGRRNDRVGRPTSIFTTPGSSFCGGGPNSHRRTEDEADKTKNHEFSQYYAEFQVIAADLDWNPSGLRNALRIGLSEEMKESFTYSDMPGELPTFVTVCQKRDIQIRQRRAEKAARNKGSGIGFTSSRPTPAPRAPETAPAGTVAGYTGPAPMDLSAGKKRISAEERAKRFANGRCLYCGGFNHRAAECAARKKAQTFKAAGAEVKEVGTKDGSEESGKD